MSEIYKDIKGFEGLYQISNLGNVYDLKKCKLRNIYDNGRGYKSACLNHKHHYIHRLVGINFIENPENKKEINHIDGNPSNNNIDNLEWCTRSENLKHKYRVLKWEPQRGMLGRKNELCRTSKELFQISLDGFIINIFPSVIEAHRQGLIDRRNLSRHIKNKTKYKGFLWA